MAIFTLLYPFLLIQALHSRPPAGDVLPAGAEADEPPAGPGRLRVPIFVLAQNALAAAEWLLHAVGRERGGSLGGLRDKLSGGGGGARY